jgi:purine-binding chemotaxis protein CheW
MSALSAAAGAEAAHEYVTVEVGPQLFGLPIDRVHDIFVATALTPVPLAPPEVVGLLNLRGRVVTALCLRRRLGLDESEAPREMAVGIEHHGESYGLLVDAVGDVLTLAAETREPAPSHLDPRWAALAAAIHRLDGRLLVVLDVDALLALDAEAAAS